MIARSVPIVCHANKYFYNKRRILDVFLTKYIVLT
jgi:hypothetical protein